LASFNFYNSGRAFDGLSGRAINSRDARNYLYAYGVIEGSNNSSVQFNGAQRSYIEVSGSQAGASTTAFRLGSGSDSLSIYAYGYQAPGSKAITATALRGSTTKQGEQLSQIDLGNGNNSASFSSNAWGQARQDWSFNQRSLRWEPVWREAARQAVSVGVSQYSISAGSGNDNLRFESSASAQRSESTAVFNTRINSGAGNDNVIVSAWAEGTQEVLSTGLKGSRVLADQKRNTLDTGLGDDYLEISANANGISNGRWLRGARSNRSNWVNDVQIANRATAIGVDSYTVTTGAGNDRINIDASASAANPLAVGIQFSTLDSGSGNDSINIHANTRNNLQIDPAYGAISSTITTGTGDDYLSIGAFSTGLASLEAIGLKGGSTRADESRSVVDTGSGNDTINISANANGVNNNRWNWGNPQIAEEAVAIGVDSYTIRSGDGSDNISINASASASNPLAVGIQYSTLDSGSGADNVSIWADSRDNVRVDPAYGALSSIITTGTGDDYLSIGASATGLASLEAIGLKGGTTRADQSRSVVDTGSGNDTINISANANGVNNNRLNWWSPQIADEGVAIGVDSYTIRTGSGDDSFSVSASASAATPLAIGMRDSQLITHTGNDQIDVSAQTSNTRRVDPAIGLQVTKIDSGEGNDYLYINTSAVGQGELQSIGLDGGEFYTQYLNSEISTGNGDDQVRINTSSSGQSQGWWWGLSGDASSKSIQSYQINLGDGNNLLQVNTYARGETASSISLSDTYVTAGSGDDIVELSSWIDSAQAQGASLVLVDSSIDLGEGNNSITLSGTTLNSWIRAGDGWDTLTNLFIRQGDIQRVSFAPSSYIELFGYSEELEEASPGAVSLLLEYTYNGESFDITLEGLDYFFFSDAEFGVDQLMAWAENFDSDNTYYPSTSAEALALIDSTEFFVTDSGSISTADWTKLISYAYGTGSGFTNNFIYDVYLDANLGDFASSIWMETLSEIDALISLDFNYTSDVNAAHLVISNASLDAETLGVNTKYLEAGSSLTSGNYQTIQIDSAQLEGLSSELYYSNYKHVALHEISHAVGLEHPFEESDGDIWIGSDPEDPFNSGPTTSETVMAYRSDPNLPGLGPSTLSSVDIEALQSIWGSEDNSVAIGSSLINSLDSAELSDAITGLGADFVVSNSKAVIQENYEINTASSAINSFDASMNGTTHVADSSSSFIAPYTTTESIPTISMATDTSSAIISAPSTTTL